MAVPPNITVNVNLTGADEALLRSLLGHTAPSPSAAPPVTGKSKWKCRTVPQDSLHIERVRGLDVVSIVGTEGRSGSDVAVHLFATDARELAAELLVLASSIESDRG